MKYLALLRGINVGGRNIIKMTSLQAAVEECGFIHVTTFIQSGNVIFDTEEKDSKTIVSVLERHLSKTFSYQSRIVVITVNQLRNIVAHVPNEWKTSEDLRCYIAFVIPPTTPTDILSAIKPKLNIDKAKAGEGVLYMSTLLSGITKSSLTKLVGTKVYQNITIRNFNTATRLLSLMIKGWGG